VACLQGPGGDDIPRNFSMSDLMAMGQDLMGPLHQPQLDAEFDLGGGSSADDEMPDGDDAARQPSH
jgi:hypothetical protein